MWAAESNITVHFILDGINLKTLVQKLSLDPLDDHKPFTGCELRWIYRNRYHEKVKKNVQFWLDGRPTVAPWLRTSDAAFLWEDYDLLRISK